MTNEYGVKLDRNGYAPSIMKVTFMDSPCCFECGVMSGKIDRHEVFHGAYREKSKRLGLWVNLCHECHMRLHQRDAHMDRALKNVTQQMAMIHYKWTEDDFRKEFGKNYLNIFEED